MKRLQRFRGLRETLGAKWSVVLLLLPPAIFGSIHFGARAAFVLVMSIVLCSVASILPRMLTGQQWRVFNPGTLITALLLGLTLSTDTPVYMIVVGALVAELATKSRIPRLGRPLFNPAALGRGAVALLEVVDPPALPDAFSGASPLMLSAGGHAAPDYLMHLLLGFTKGAIGETSALVLLCVGILMLAFVVIKRE